MATLFLATPPDFQWLLWITNDNSKQYSRTVLSRSVLEHSISLQVLAVLRVSTTSILLLFSPCLSPICFSLSHGWLLVPVPDIWSPLLHQDGEGQQEGMSVVAFAARRGGLWSTQGWICTVQMPVGGMTGMTCAQLRQKLYKTVRQVSQAHGSWIFFFFQKLQTQPNLYTFSSKKIKERFLCVFVRQDMIPVTCRTPSVNQALNTFFLVF